MFESLEEDIRKVDNEPEDRNQHMMRVFGFVAIIGGITLVVFSVLYAAIRFME
jgi:hypothetical protein